jgi:hypothetical protein
MGILGSAIGRIGGGFLGNLFGNKDAGSGIGGILGGLLPFEAGGQVPMRRGKPVPALLHGGEYVLPAGVKPTKAQKKMVADRKKKKK